MSKNKLILYERISSISNITYVFTIIILLISILTIDITRMICILSIINIVGFAILMVYTDNLIEGENKCQRLRAEK